jgi:hypothetical protein
MIFKCNAHYQYSPFTPQSISLYAYPALYQQFVRQALNHEPFSFRISANYFRSLRMSIKLLPLNEKNFGPWYAPEVFLCGIKTLQKSDSE